MLKFRFDRRIIPITHFYSRYLETFEFLLLLTTRPYFIPRLKMLRCRRGYLIFLCRLDYFRKTFGKSCLPLADLSLTHLWYWFTKMNSHDILDNFLPLRTNFKSLNFGQFYDITNHKNFSFLYVWFHQITLPYFNHKFSSYSSRQFLI